MASFAFIPICALFLFLFEFCILIAAKRNPLVTCFTVMLVFLILWSAGSALMRIQFLGLIDPWFHLSLIGIWVACVALDELLCRFQRKHLAWYEKVLALVLVVMLVANVATGWFLAPPALQELSSGVVAFVYGNFTIGTYLMYGVFAVFSGSILMRVSGCVRCRSLTSAQALPISVGTVFMIVGQILIMLPPFAGIPLDIVAGIVFGACCFVSLYNKHLFPLTLAFSRRTYALATLLMVVLFSSFFVDDLVAFFSGLPNPLGSNSVTCVVLLLVALAFSIYGLCKRLSDSFFLKDQTSRTESLKGFQEDISRSLSVADISELYCHQVAQDVPRVRNVRICLKDAEGNMVVAGSSIPFEAGTVLFESRSAVVDWLTNHKDVLTPAEFSRSVEFRSMWESEQAKLRQLDLHCVVPLIADDQLIGLSTIALKDPRGSLTINDMDHLLGLSSVMAVSVRNCQLYELAAQEARSDDLTGLLNRKHFYKAMDELSADNPNRVMSLVLINIDDFKLYNQLYGEAMADDLLRRISLILTQTAGEGNLIGRIGGKEFAILMPDRDTSAARRLAENLQQQIFHMNRDGSYDEALKVVTCSIGICSMPFDAHTVKQLLDNANLAVFQVKQRGKNAIMVYSTGMAQAGQQASEIDHKSVYSTYADTIYALTAAIDAKDHYTFTHSNNVAYYASVLASAYGLNAETVEIVREAAMLHDIGKISIPESILQKPGRLTADEYEIMKKHPENAVAIIRHLPSMDYVSPAVVGHHERWDGKGYPRRLAGEDIPLAARILCIADCFDAITTKRCYQDPREMQNALRIIEDGAGTQFDPELARLFIEKANDGTIELQATR